MKHFILVLILFNTSFVLSDTGDIFIAKGKTIPVFDIGNSNIHITDRKILSAKIFSGRILLSGHKLGSTTLTYGTKSRNVHVLNQNDINFYEKTKEHFKKLKGLRIELIGGELKIVGRLHRVSDWKDIIEIAKLTAAKYTFAAQPDQDIKKDIRALLISHTSALNLPHPSIEFLDNEIKLSIHSDKADNKTSISSLKALGLDPIFLKNNLDISPMIEVTILVAEIRRSEFLRLGIGWPTQYNAQVLPKIKPSNLEVTINALETKGNATLLASPKILGKSGKKSSFLAGGEIPIRVSGWSDKGVVWKKYGIQLDIKPIADWRGRMSIEITSEVSSIDSSQSVNGIPGFRTNRISSHFNLEREKTIALSGLIKERKGIHSEGLPLLSRIPILGHLFSSKDFQNEQSELVFFVTPKVVNEVNYDKRSRNH